MAIIAIAPSSKLHDYEEAVRRAGGEARVLDSAARPAGRRRARRSTACS